MATGDIRLGASGSEYLLSPFGRRFRERDIEIARQDRTASGRLVKDIIATKKEFTIEYEIITSDALETLITIWELQAQLSLIVSRSDITDDSYDVLMEPMERERFRLHAGGLWTGVSIRLSEV